MLFTVKLVQHSDQNATHVVKQTTGHQYVSQMEQNQNKGRGHKAENTKNQNLTINHNIGEISTWKLMQYATTKKLRNKWKAWYSIVLIWPKEMLYTGSELMQISRTWSRIVQYARKTFWQNQRKLYNHMTSPAEHRKLSAQIYLTAIIMNIW